MKIITPYSTYLVSKYSKAVKEKVSCECCGKIFFTNVGRKRCYHECAKKARKQNKIVNK